LGQDSDAGRLLGRIGGGARRWFRSFVARLRHRRLFARSGAFLRGLRAQADPRARRLPRSYAAWPARLARNGRSRRYWADGGIIRRLRKSGSSPSTGKKFPICTNSPGQNSQRPAVCRRRSFPWGSPKVCRAACKSSALTLRTGRRSPSPARSSASSAASCRRPATHRGVRAVRHTRRRWTGLSASDRRGGENRERGEGVLETLAMRSHS
jgi:hypothetical protein